MKDLNSTQPTTRHDPNAIGREFKRKLNSGELIIGSMVFEYLRPSLAKIFASAGFDFIFIEKEHAFFDGHELPDFVLSARDSRIPIISKISTLNRTEITRLLDAGVVAIQLPRTESRKQLLTLRNYMKFAPMGTRAGAPCFGNVDYAWASSYEADARSWLEDANECTLMVAQIETKKGYENAEEVISTPGLDMLYVGPYDLSVSMGQPGAYDHPDVVGPMREMLELCKKYKVPFGTTPLGPESAAEWIAAGAQFFDVVDELGLIAKGSKEVVSLYQKLDREVKRS